jgi:Zn-dependent membrane protease YugP
MDRGPGCPRHSAAAWTYVASALVAVLHLFRLLILSGLLGGSDE